jgi:hypothetical protein
VRTASRNEGRCEALRTAAHSSRSSPIREITMCWMGSGGGGSRRRRQHHHHRRRQARAAPPCTGTHRRKPTGGVGGSLRRLLARAATASHSWNAYNCIRFTQQGVPRSIQQPGNEGGDSASFAATSRWFQTCTSICWSPHRSGSAHGQWPAPEHQASSTS